MQIQSEFIYIALGIALAVIAIAGFWLYKRPTEVKPTVIAPPQPTEQMPVEEKIKPLSESLKSTKSQLLGRIRGLLSKSAQISANELEQLEEILFTSDIGTQTVQKLMDNLQSRRHSGQLTDFNSLENNLRDQMKSIFSSVPAKSQVQGPPPCVLMIVGVNGAGKTTTIGKFAHNLAMQGKKVMIAAGDTFRAAARDQLKIWSDRAEVEIFDIPETKDPSAVAYGAVERAKQKQFDFVIIDTAGRLHTQKNLMEELKKMKRVIQKLIPEAPHEILLILDANQGQNALAQAKEFHAALNVTGVILTKMDGTAKGGVALGVVAEVGVPLLWIGVGEKMSDLRPFSADEFVDSIFSDQASLQ